ncbi:MAG: CPBP family glutamic-type intramembrane protease, partial [Clostridia bacterium]
IFHMNPAQTLHQFILGVLLSYFLVATGSSWTPIIVHFVNNLVAIILELTVGDAFIENGKWWLLGIGLVAFAVFFTLFVLTNKTERKDVLTESAEPVIVDKIVLTVGVMCCIGMWIATLFAK